MTDVFDATVFAPPRQSKAANSRGGTTPFATNVRFSRDGVPPLGRAARGVKRVGLNYERRVTDVLSAIYGDSFVPQPMIYYSRFGRAQRAIPDGLLYLDSGVLIVEVKLAHTATVWDQLMERYAPLVAILHPRLRVRTVEICRSYDPAVDIPHSVITSLHTEPAKAPLEVLRWRI